MRLRYISRALDIYIKIYYIQKFIDLALILRNLQRSYCISCIKK